MLLAKRSEKLIASIHQYQKHRSSRGPFGRVLCRVGKLRHVFWTLVTASDINRSAQIAKGVRFPHPNGVVVHKDAVIGEGCLIMQQVTIGQMALGPAARNGAPTIGDGAYIGAGAKVIGGIRIGERARVGANAVVLVDVPDDAIAVGVPARIIERQESTSS